MPSLMLIFMGEQLEAIINLKPQNPKKLHVSTKKLHVQTYFHTIWSLNFIQSTQTTDMNGKMQLKVVVVLLMIIIRR